MLDSKTISALGQAIKAVLDECGDDPEYAALRDSLSDAPKAIADLSAGAEPERDGPEDDHSFDVAQERMTAARKPKADEGDA